MGKIEFIDNESCDIDDDGDIADNSAMMMMILRV